MSRVKRVELGCAGHLIVAMRCGWRRHTRIGGYRVSTVGDYYPSENSKRTTVGCNRFFETMVFRVEDPDEDGAEGCGCGTVHSYEEIDFEGYNTAGDARVGHEKMVAKYHRIARNDLIRNVERGG